jgi:DNA-directed RNA polymerase subunit alpha
MQESWRDLSKPKSIEVEEETLTPTYGRFFGEPFERGFGTTLGNALRRVLLSSLSGAAITTVRIQGVLHEFSTVPGATEDVTDILLNLKEVRFRLRDSDTETARLDARGEREVTAAALIVGPQAEILNPGTHLATLGKEAHLELEAIIQRGRGYVTAERHKSEEDPLGTIPLDAAFSPVRKVNFTVSNARVGQRTDYERLSLEIWTDGSINPKEALASAARELQSQLSIFVAVTTSAETGEWPPKVSEAPSVTINENLLRPIEELNLSVRSANCLQSADLRYVGELVQKTEADLLRTKNFGRKSLNEIKETLHNMGLELGMQLENFPAREELERRRIAEERELN